MISAIFQRIFMSNIVLLLAFLNFGTTLSNEDLVQILEVSTQIGLKLSIPEGSIEGGTKLYMKVTGLDQIADNNQVYLGQNLCDIPENGINELKLICVTRKPQNSNSLLNNQIVVSVAGKKPSTCNLGDNYCQYSYKDKKTPFLYIITPKINFVSQKFSLKTKTYFTTLNDKYQEGVYIDKNICQSQQTTGINENEDLLFCLPQAPQKLNSNIQIKSSIGNSNPLQIINVPIITKISSNVLSPNGYQLEIFGLGFENLIASQLSVRITNQSENIEVIQSDRNKITIKIPPLQSLPTLQELQLKPQIYLSGSGLQYTLYDLQCQSETLSQFIQDAANPKSNLQSCVKYDGIQSMPDYYQKVTSQQGQYYRGFLKVPKTGNYQFYLASSGEAKFFINLNTLTATHNNTVTAESKASNIYRNYWGQSLIDSIQQVTSISESLLLNQDEYYFIELFNIQNEIKDGFLTLSYESSEYFEDNVFAQTVQSNEIWTITMTQVGVSVDFKIYNTQDNSLPSSPFKLKFSQLQSSGEWTDILTDDIYFTDDLDTIFTKLQSKISNIVFVTQAPLDSQGELIIDSDSFAGYIYSIGFQFGPNLKFGYDDSLDISTIHIEFSKDLIEFSNGEFQLILEYEEAQQQITFTKVQSIQELQDAIFSIMHQRPIIWKEGSLDAFQIWFIKFYSCDMTNGLRISVDQSNTQKEGFKLQIKKPKACSKNLYEPIPIAHVFTFTNRPQIQVIFNGLTLGCQLQACNVVLNRGLSLKVMEQKKSDNVLTLQLQLGSDYQPKANQFTVWLAGAECLEISVARVWPNYALTCKLELLNSQIVAEAGINQFPIVYHSYFGYAVMDTTVTPFETDFLITNINPNQGSVYGGTVIKISGSGFPKDQNSKLEILFGTQLVSPISVNNQQIIISSLPKSSDDTVLITLKFNEKILTFNFEYNSSLDLLITSITPNEIPINFQGDIIIQGYGFGEISSNVIVGLKIGENSLTFPIKSIKNDQIAFSIGQMKPGKYQLSVVKTDIGNAHFSNVDQNYITVQFGIQQVSLKDGSQAVLSKAGGTIIKIQGFGFVKYATTVVIADQLCEIILDNFTETEFQCISPSLPQFYSEIQQVKIYYQYKMLALLPDNLQNSQVLYSQDQTPTILNYPENSEGTQSSIPDYQNYQTQYRNLWSLDKSSRSQILQTHQLIAGFDQLGIQQLSVTMRKLYKPGQQENLQISTTINGQIYVSFVGPIIQTIQTTLSQNNIAYTIPNLPEGEYITTLKCDLGNMDKNWITQIALTVDQVSEGFNYGSKITITGSGFNKDQQLQVQVGTTNCKIIQVINYQQIDCEMETQSLDIQSEQVTITQISTVTQEKISTQVSINLQADVPAISVITFNDAEYNFDSQSLDVVGDVLNIQVTTEVALDKSSIYLRLISGENQFIQQYKVQEDEQAEGTLTNFIFQSVPIGNYIVTLRVGDKNAKQSNNQVIKISIKPIQPKLIQSLDNYSFFGKQSIKIGINGFDNKYNIIKICGQVCKVIEVYSDIIECIIPKIPVQQALTADLSQQVGQKLTVDNFIFENNEQILKLFDQKQTTYYQSNENQCSVLIKTPPNQYLKLQKIKFSTRIDNQLTILQGSKLQYTTDLTNWIDIYYFDIFTTQGWNSIYKDINNVVALKLINENKDNDFACSLAELEIYGWIFYKFDETAQQLQCNIDISINDVVVQNSLSIIYKINQRLKVNTVTPQIGGYFTQTIITIVGEGFIESKTVILIDGINCEIQEFSVTQIKCQTGQKQFNNELMGQFQVYVDGIEAEINDKFVYTQLWSDPITWSNIIPISGSSVIIPKQLNVLIDVEHIILDRLIIEGRLTFSDEIDIKLEANYIIVNEGQFIVGQENQTHQKSVEIVLQGDANSLKFPIIGNKVLACYNCIIEIHGMVQSKQWTYLKSSAIIGSNQIILTQLADWQVGDKILIASSTLNEEEHEIKTITGKIVDKNTLILDDQLQFNHTVDATITQDQVEVVLLNRNIKFYSQLDNNDYGLQLLFFGDDNKGSTIRISNVEIFNGGQTESSKQFVHFFQTSDLRSSYIKSSSIYNSYANCIVLESTSFLEVSNNVCYNIVGNGIQILGGDAYNNAIKNNLVLKISNSNSLSILDQNAASFYLSNPKNFVEDNRSSGSQGSGFILNINQHTQSDPDQCPLGSDIISFKNNIAHLSSSKGLQVNVITSNTIPCSSLNFNQSPQFAVLNKNFLAFNNQQDLLVSFYTSKSTYMIDQKFEDINPFDLEFLADPNFSSLQKSILLKLKYQKSLDSVDLEKGQQYIQSSVSLEASTCTFGQWINNSTEKSLTVCLQGAAVLNSLSIAVVSNQVVNESGNQTNSSDIGSGNTNQTNTNTNSTENGGTSETNTDTNSTNSGSGVTNSTDSGGTNQSGANSTNTNTNSTDIGGNNSTITNSNSTDNGETNSTNTNTNSTDIQGTNSTSTNTNSTDVTNSTSSNSNDNGGTNSTDTNTNSTESTNTTSTDTNSTNGGTNQSDNGSTNSNTNSTVNGGTNTSDNGGTNQNNTDANQTEYYPDPEPVTYLLSYYLQYHYNPGFIRIQLHETIIFDYQSETIEVLEIMGVLQFIYSQQINQLKVATLKVFQEGKLIAGTQNSPFGGKIEIILTQAIFRISSTYLYSYPPQTISSRMLNYSLLDNQIEVESCSGWKVGDEITVGFQKQTIAQMNGCKITLLEQWNQTYNYNSFSDAIIGTKSDFDSFDTRMVVAHLTRRIRIIGANKPIIVEADGNYELVGVEFVNCGDSDNPCLYTQSWYQQTIQSSTFHDSEGQFFKSQGQVGYNDYNLRMNNNVFFNGKGKLVELIEYKWVQFNNNLLIKVQKSKNSKVSVLGSFGYTSSISIQDRRITDFSNNIGLYSEDVGFEIIGTYCENATNSAFQNLECQYADGACFVVYESNPYCTYVGNLRASTSSVGILFAATSDHLQLDNVMSIENGIGIDFKTTPFSQTNSTIKFSNSIVSALRFSNCPKCYQVFYPYQYLYSRCTQSIGIQLATASSKTMKLSQYYNSTLLDQVFSNGRLDQRVFIINVKFLHYKTTYDFEGCAQNYVFRQNPTAVDGSGRHYLRNTQCIDCEFDAFFFQFYNGNEKFYFQYFGYWIQAVEREKLFTCGKLICTGFINVLIEDQTGDFFGEKAQVIGNNSMGKNLDYCERKNQWNGYYCKGTNLQVLNFMSVALDYQTRSFSPLSLYGDRLQNFINSYFDWQENFKRQQSFTFLIEQNSTTYIQLSGDNPTESQYWLSNYSSKSNSTNDYVIVQQKISLRASPFVFVNKKKISRNIPEKNLESMSHICGANNYYTQSAMFEFVLNTKDGCIVTLSFYNALVVETVVAQKKKKEIIDVSDIFLTFEFILYNNRFLYELTSIEYSHYGNRLLGETNEDEENIEFMVKIQWEIADQVPIGMPESQDSEQLLSACADNLSQLVLNPDYGTLIQHTSTLHVIKSLSELKGNEDEQQSNQGSNSTNQEPSQNQSDNGEEEENTENQIPLEFIVENEKVNDEQELQPNVTNNKNNTIISEELNGEKKQQNHTVIIILAVLVPTVGIILTVCAIVYYKRKKAQTPDKQKQKYTLTSTPVETVQNTVQNHKDMTLHKKVSIEIVVEQDLIQPQDHSSL